MRYGSRTARTQDALVSRFLADCSKYLPPTGIAIQISVIHSLSAASVRKSTLHEGLSQGANQRLTTNSSVLLCAASSIFSPHITFTRAEVSNHNILPQPSQSRRMTRQGNSGATSPFSPAIFVTGLVTAFGLWIITGALAYNDRNHPSANTQDAGVAFTGVIVPITFLLVVGNTLPEYARIASPPRKATSPAITIVLIFCISCAIAYCIATSSNRRLLEHVFLVLSSAYAGLLLEVVTGLVTGCLRRLEAVAAS